MAIWHVIWRRARAISTPPFGRREPPKSAAKTVNMLRLVLALALVATSAAFVAPRGRGGTQQSASTVVVSNNPISRFFEGLDDFIDDAMDRKALCVPLHARRCRRCRHRRPRHHLQHQHLRPLPPLSPPKPPETPAMDGPNVSSETAPSSMESASPRFMVMIVTSGSTRYRVNTTK